MPVVSPAPTSFDVAIIGAGPVGLFAVCELGLLDLNAVVIDTLEKAGGQCADLYPEKSIDDIPSWPVVTGQQLTDKPVEQIAPIAPRLELGRLLTHLGKLPDGRIMVHTNAGDGYDVVAVFIAAGTGGYAPRRLKLEGVDAFEDRSLFHSVNDGANSAFASWVEAYVFPHRQPGYEAVTISLKSVGEAPGDATSAPMRAVADLEDTYWLGEIRVPHAQNLVLPNVKQADLFGLWQKLSDAALAEDDVGLTTDIIFCPALDDCALATARSIPIAESIAKRFSEATRQREIGPPNIKVSGGINACGHHHVGHIGILEHHRTVRAGGRA